VTAVDTQGNESAALDVTVNTDTPSAGIYTVSWTEEEAPAGGSVSYSSGTGSERSGAGSGSVTYE